MWFSFVIPIISLFFKACVSLPVAVITLLVELFVVVCNVWLCN